MNYKSPFLLLIVLVLSFTSLSAETVQYDHQQIEKFDIVIEQFSSVSSCDVKSIRARLKTKEGDIFSQIDFDNDLKNLAKDFHRIDPNLQSINGKMHVSLKIWPRPTIRSITWQGNTHMGEKVLLTELGIKCSSPFDRLSFNKAFHKLKAYYIKNGFFEAELDYEESLDTCSNEVDIVVTINEGRAGHINEIIFEGFTEGEKCELLDMLVTKEYNALFSWYTNEGIYHEEAIQQDQFMIINYLQNEGYADAKVDISIVETKVNRINIYIKATKGQHYTICGVTFKGNKIFSDEEISNVILLESGSSYSPEKIRETVLRISDLYGRRGYIDAFVDFEPSLNIETLSYSLHLTIEEGAQHRVGMIKVFGNCTTQTNIILHESLLIPGEIFNIDSLKRTEQKLLNVGYFENVNVYAVKSEGLLGLGDCYRDVHIEVKETSTGNFGAFAGFSTAESLFGGINITERNFNYKGFSNIWRDGFQALRGGGEYAHATIQVGLKSRKYIFSWAKPFFMDTPWTVGFDVERSNNRYISDDYDITSDAFTLHATYRINSFVRFGWHYRLKNSNVGIEHNKDDKGTLAHDARLGGLISASGISWTYDSTDHPILPRKGIKSRLELEYVGLGGDHTYFCASYLNGYYRPLTNKGVFKLRADFRFILPFGSTGRHDVPLDERLFLGGDSLVRGYRSYRLGPLYDGTDDPRGGISQQYYSAEFAYKWHDKLEPFVFIDAGFLDQNPLRVGRPFVSSGFGTRIKIIESIPSLTLGVGFPLNAKKSTQVKNFFITVGGKF
ncbi:MAG: outer membrane protein assembly factor BamA [Parachlamydiaceae bacterium]|nr:outer membrane protein assembly factor BamA [Parachlamydiaceae bacterium]